MLFQPKLPEHKIDYLKFNFELLKEEHISITSKLLESLKELRKYEDYLNMLVEKFRGDKRWMHSKYEYHTTPDRQGPHELWIIEDLFVHYKNNLKLAIEELKKIIKQLKIEEKIDIKLYKDGKFEILRAEARKELWGEKKAIAYLEKLSEAIRSIKSKIRWTKIMIVDAAKIASGIKYRSSTYNSLKPILDELDNEDTEVIHKLADIHDVLDTLVGMINSYYVKTY